MKLKIKDIDLQANRKCKICNRINGKNGIMIKDNLICKSCTENIVNIDINNKDYDSIKDKLKIIINKFKLF